MTLYIMHTADMCTLSSCPKGGHYTVLMHERNMYLTKTVMIHT